MTATTRHVVADSPIGPLTLVRDDDGLTGLEKAIPVAPQTRW